MSRYKVAFSVNGTVHRVRCSSVKVGNMFLQCKDETVQNDQATVAMVPFDAVDYIVHESVSVNFDDAAGTGDADGDTMLDGDAMAGSTPNA